MYLTDYAHAINYLISVLQPHAICISQVSCNVFGNSFIFAVDSSTERYAVWRGGLVEKIYNDTWRNPDHREIITEGDGKEIW